jgi:hypothetical protein
MARAWRHLGQAEVEHLHPPVSRDHHVLRLDVPVGDPLRVGSSQRLSQGQSDLQQLLRTQGTRREDLGQQLPVHELHGEEADPLCLLN